MRYSFIRFPQKQKLILRRTELHHDSTGESDIPLCMFDGCVISVLSLFAQWSKLLRSCRESGGLFWFTCSAKLKVTLANVMYCLNVSCLI